MSDMLPRPEPRDRFRRALRAHIMAQAPGALAPRETTWSRFQHSVTRPALAAAAVGLIIVAGTGKAAADSLPGDAAYPIKLAAEQVQLAFALDDATRLRALAEQADHRLAELTEAISTRTDKAPAAGDAYATAVRALTVAVDRVRSQPNVSEDKKTAAGDVVDAAYQKHEQVLGDLEELVSPSQRSDVDRAKQESDKLHPSDRPARTPEPTDRPDRTRSPQPTRTAPPSRSPEPTGTASPESTQGERNFTPAPPVRR